MSFYRNICSSFIRYYKVNMNMFHSANTTIRFSHTCIPINLNTYISQQIYLDSFISGNTRRCKTLCQNTLRSFSSSETANEFYIPRRCILYIPGNDKRKLSKISDIKADCVVMDCEDGVAESKKDEARKTIYEVLQKKNEIFANKDCSVRINGVETDHFEVDLKEVLLGPVLPSTLLLPKVENEDHIKIFSDRLKKFLDSRNTIEKVRLIIYVESAKSLLNLQSICEYTKKISKSSYFILDGVVFGSDDFCADIGATRTSEAKELNFARQWVVTVAKSFGLQAIDVVYIDYKDLQGLKRQSEEGNQFGFTGKQVIHPSQVDIVQAAFSPSAEKILWAEELIKSFKKHQEEGKGAFTFEGNMIDRPLLLQAENVLKIASASRK